MSNEVQFWAIIDGLRSRIKELESEILKRITISDPNWVKQSPCPKCDETWTYGYDKDGNEYQVSERELSEAIKEDRKIPRDE